MSLFLLCSFLINIAFSATIDTATSGNSSHQYFITSEYGTNFNFQFDTVNCGGSYCHIICDETAGCFEIQINAASVSTLIIECLTEQSCKTLQLLSAPTTNLNIYCSAKEACSGATVSAPTTTNVNLACNYSNPTTTTSFGGCYNLQLNASQSTSIDIKCLGIDSCYGADYYLNNAGSVTINAEGMDAMRAGYLYGDHMQTQLDITCGYYACQYFYIHTQYMTGPITATCSESYSCRSMQILADHMTDPVSLTCSASYSCRDSKVNGTDMSSSMTVNCLDSYGCRDANFYCPIAEQCNFDCDVANSCYNTRFHIPDTYYTGMNLQCNPAYTTSCYIADIQCTDAGTSTQLTWDSSITNFRCNTYGCCSFSEGTINCSPGAPCVINCNAGSCRNHLINATLATSLTLDCSDTTGGCDAATILCPTGDSTSCSISCTGYRCQYASISTGIGNTMSSFSLDCGYSNACQYTSVSLTSASITDVSIDCSSTYSCRYSAFSIASSVSNSLNISCSSTGCYSISIDVSSLLVNNLLWECTASSSCNSAVMTLAQNAIINSYKLACSASSSCSTIQLNAENSVIGDLDVDCIYCHSMDITTSISKSAYINCGGSEACEIASVSLTSTTPNVNINIDCINPIPSTSYTVSACYNSNWYLNGYITANGDKNNNFTLQCSQYDCRSAKFYANDLYKADVLCDAPYSCNLAQIRTGSVEKLGLTCTNNYACNAASVYCPYQEEKSCTITCTEQTRTCYAMQIHVPGSYIYDYLQLTCASEEIYPTSDACMTLDVNCDTGTRSQAVYTYNHTLHDYECSNSATSYCCPHFKGTKKTCASGQKCSMDCTTTNSNCASAFIDATDATYLTLDCEGSDCRDSVIHCPVGGCSINCIGSSACYGSSFVYPGQISDNGVMSVNCSGSSACYGASITADYVSEFDMACIGKSGSNYQVCRNANVYANYANKVVIDLIEDYAGHYSNFYAQNAKAVRLLAKGDYSFYYSKLYADDAGSLIMTFSSESSDYATRYSDYWVPQNTTINCYGYGCYYLADIYRGANKDATGLQFNVEGCGECTSITNCIYNFYVRCDSGTGSTLTDTFSRGCSSYNNCGCRDAINNAKYSIISVGNQCYGSSADRTCTSGSQCVIDCSYSSGGCYSDLIDGTSAKYLTVNCGYSNYCNYASIWCPVGGCTINCDGDNVCYKAQIYYTGTEATQKLNQNGNVSVICTDDEACDYTEIYATYADTVNIECHQGISTNTYGVCYHTTLDAERANQVILTFDGYRASYYATWNVDNVTNVTVDAGGYYAFRTSYLHAEYAGSVVINCADDSSYACYNSDYYVPYDTTFNCYGSACSDLGDIHLTTTSTGLQMNAFGCSRCTTFSGCVGTFYMYCPAGGTSQRTCSPSSGYTSSDYCGCNELRSNRMTYVSSSSTNCYVEPSPQPTGKPTSDAYYTGCSYGSDCDVSCTSSCSSTGIDGSTYNYLTVTCDSSYDCQYSTIICPVGGCHIKCTGYASCYYTDIQYNGYTTDKGTVQVDCGDSEHACYYTTITANYASTVTLNCNAPYSGYDKICYYLSLYAQYADTVNIVGNYKYALYYANLYVQNANSVYLTGYGDYVFYNSELYATSAGSVSIKYTADSYDKTSYSSDYYLPSTTTFDCYGPGCEDLGTFYLASSSTMDYWDFNINACGDCDDQEDCLGELTFYCGYSYNVYENYDQYTSYSSCSGYSSSSSSYCGCDHFIDLISFTDLSSDSECYQYQSIYDSGSGDSGGSISGATIGIVIGVILAVCGIVAFFWWIHNSNKSKSRAAKPYTPAVRTTPRTNYNTTRYNNNTTATRSPAPVYASAYNNNSSSAAPPPAYSSVVHQPGSGNNVEMTQQQKQFVGAVVSLQLIEKCGFSIASELNKAVLLEALKQIQPSGQTALRDAIALGVLKMLSLKAVLNKIGVIGHKFIHIVLTDGADNRSQNSLQDIRGMYYEIGKEIGDKYFKTFFVGIGLGYTEKQQLQSIADLAGDAAELMHCNDVQIADVFDRIKLSLGIQRRVALVTDGTNFVAAKQDRLCLQAEREKFLVLFDLDMSGSMGGLRWNKLQAALSGFFTALDNSDIVGCVLFNHEAVCITGELLSNATNQ